MDVVQQLLGFMRGGSRAGRALEKVARAVYTGSVAPTGLHRALLAERSLRRQLSDELARALNNQPMFTLLCDRVEGPYRLEVCPDSKLPPVIGCRLRLGRNVRLSARTTFSGGRKAPGPAPIVVGDDSYVGHRVSLRAGLGIRIGRRCYLASNVTLSGDPGHPLDPARRRTEAAPLEDLGHIELGDDVWIAEGATILGNVTIGDGAVVGARAVVTRDVPPRTLVVGAPAKVVRIVGGPGAEPPAETPEERGAALG